MVDSSYQANDLISGYTGDSVQQSNGFIFNIDFSKLNTWAIISLILAVVISLVVFFLFVKSNTNFKNKFVAWLKEFLNFRSILIENILKYLYLFCTVFMTFISFSLITENFLGFLVVLVGSNVLIRIIFEFLLSMIMIWKNTSDICNYSKNIKDNIEKK
ncbi:MAG: hypothetical protein IKJ43_02660 [Bacilli bacterium]|nr:hypothetical protein [Bacilli bacterium]